MRQPESLLAAFWIWGLRLFAPWTQGTSRSTNTATLPLTNSNVIETLTSRVCDKSTDHERQYSTRVQIHATSGRSLLGPAKWTYFYLYVMLDVFSRYFVS